MTTTQETPQPIARRWPAPLTQQLPTGQIACGACGVPVRDTADAETITIQVTPETVVQGRGGTVVTAGLTVDVRFGRCAGPGLCAERREFWGRANERLATAAHLLGYSGSHIDDTLDAAGLRGVNTDAGPFDQLRFQDWVTRAARSVDPRAESRAQYGHSDPRKDAVEARAALCTSIAWGHVTAPVTDSLTEAQTAGRNKAAGIPQIFRAPDAARQLLGGSADHRLTEGCFGCGVQALSAPYGTPVSQIWTAYYSPVSPFTRTLRGPGSRAGNVAGLLCSVCGVPEDGSISGEALASALLSGADVPGGFDGDPEHYAPGAVTAALWGSQTLRARILGLPEPAPSARRWAHLTAPLAPVDDVAAETLDDMAKEAKSLKAKAADDAATTKAIAVEIDRRAQVIAKEQAVAQVKAADWRRQIDAAVEQARVLGEKRAGRR